VVKNNYIIILLLLLASCTFTVKDLDAAETNTVSSTVVTNSTPPTANSPSVVVNNSDVCTSGYSGSVQTQVLGISSGITIKDTNCEMIKLSRQLYGMQMKVAAVSTLCADYRIFDAMWMSSTFCPYMGAIGEDAKQGWLDNPHMVPKDSQVFASLAKEEQLKKKEKNNARETKHKSLDIIAILTFVAILL
tara:strand:+ start:34 stop:603 length:570 start_codon:yes stop_codon:yes gene_type:complete